MRVRVGCDVVYEAAEPAPMLFMVRPRERDGHLLLEETRDVTPEAPVRGFTDGFGNEIWRVTAPVGRFRLRYDALVDVSPLPDPVMADLPGTPVAALPDETLPSLLPSRHCQSDLLFEEAWQQFGDTPDGGARVQAICDWTHSNVIYEEGSGATTSALEAYRQRRGVCRDFAQIGIMLCRAMNIPARYVCGYLADIGVPPDPRPMDFHAWFEAYVGSAWRTFDARHNVPRIGRVVIARGRDAGDAAWATVFGNSRLVSLEVWADEVSEGATLAVGRAG
jgi:transglutaminase-like putative cysteine protease